MDRLDWIVDWIGLDWQPWSWVMGHQCLLMVKSDVYRCVKNDRLGITIITEYMQHLQFS